MNLKSKNLKELIKEFQETVCLKCRSYFFCGGEVGPCVDWQKFIKEKYNQ